MADNDIPPVPIPQAPTPPADPAAETASNPYVHPDAAAAPASPDSQPYAQQPYAQQPYGQQPYGVQPYGQPGTLPNYAPYATPGPPQGLSIGSLVCGVAGLLFTLGGFGFLPGLAAVITGTMAKNRQPWARNLWLTGLITGWISVGLGALTGLAIIAYFIFVFAVVGTSGGFSALNFPN